MTFMPTNAEVRQARDTYLQAADGAATTHKEDKMGTTLEGRAEGQVRKPATMTDTEAMTHIHFAMSGVEWDSDTLDKIAQVVGLTGRKIRDPNDSEDEVL